MTNGCKYEKGNTYSIPLTPTNIIHFRVTSSSKRQPLPIDRFTPNPGCAILNYLFEHFGEHATLNYLAEGVECQKCDQYVDLMFFGSTGK